jgi:hypothetical protein
MNGYSLSKKWFSWAFENPHLNTPTITALYFFILEKWNRCGQKGKIMLHSSEAMQAIGVKNYKTYKKSLMALIEFGFLELLQESKNQYTCNIVSLVNSTQEQETVFDEAQEPTPQQPAQQKINENTSEQTVIIEPIETLKQEQAKNAPQNENKKKNEKKKGKDPAPQDPPFTSVRFELAWQEFVEYRKSKNKKISIYAQNRIFKELAKESEDIAIAMIEKSIKNDWQGIFPLSDTEKQKIKTSSMIAQTETVGEKLPKGAVIYRSKAGTIK